MHMCTPTLTVHTQHTHTLPIGEHGYYDDETDDNPAPRDEWEDRKVLGLAWENYQGWRVETKLCDDMTGESTNYLINASLVRMIKASRRNRGIQMRSDMWVEEA